MAEAVKVSVIIPTFNGAQRIGSCLKAIQAQNHGSDVEILVVDDGSTDGIVEVVRQNTGVRLIRQANAGPAAARNRGAAEAFGTILLFTDDDCIPTSGWLSAMRLPFETTSVVGVKGVYRTHQRELTARFVQIEYEDKYRIMAAQSSIDFVDTYSAGFLRDRFLEMDGYDTSFPVACAEDIELSYRMSARGWTMKFAPDAIVYHTHPNTLSAYLRKKYKFAFWRVLAVRKNPAKSLKDSHTPQIMKLQLLLAPAVLLGIALDVLLKPRFSTTRLVCTAFLISTLPFATRATRKDPLVGALSPVLLAARACAQFLGVVAGLLHARRQSIQLSTR